MQVVTFGHGTATADTITQLLCDAHISLLLDVRSYPTSRHNPHVNRDDIARWLPEAGVPYRWEPRLGGRRKASRVPVDTAIRNPSFRAYAEHMRTTTFEDGIRDLLAESGWVAIMCSETVWWRCHRKMIADHLTLVHGMRVEHLMQDGRLQMHKPMAEAHLAGRQLVYDVGSSQALWL